MNEQKMYRVNTSKVVSETLGGETIIINLEDGSYYSLNETGSALWDIIVLGYSREQIHEFFISQYAAASEHIIRSVDALLSSFLTYGLVTEHHESLLAISIESIETKKVFTPPEMVRYDDMQEMLLADPIHDVDDIGWPKLKS